jgi:hypothetical protein
VWRWLATLAVVAACGFPRPADLTVIVNGNVHGMWTGATGGTLRLTADEVDLTYPLNANGPFVFPATVHPGASYIVVVAANPAMHTCSITAGAAGIAPIEGAVLVDVACQGPTATIALSAPASWKFEPTLEIQPVLEASVLLQNVTLTISSSDELVTSAQVSGIPITLGKPSAPQRLPLGMSSIGVDLTAKGGLTMKYQITIDRGGGAIEQATYVKASNTGRGDSFGQSIAISGDTVVVGAMKESSSSTNVNGNQLDDNAPGAGAAYVLRRVGGAWMQEAYLKESNTAPNHSFGVSVAISGDTIAVGANGAANGAGAVYIFQRVNNTWMQQAIITASNAEAGDSFGFALALSGDTLAVSAPNESSRATGVNMDQSDNTAQSSGAVYVFTRSQIVGGTLWTQQAYIKASNTDASDQFGKSIALFGDTLAVGATGEASSAKGINNAQDDNLAPASGAVYVFQRGGATWSQRAYMKASNAAGLAQFGSAIALLNDTMIVAAATEWGAATGIDGDQNDLSKIAAGAVYVFERNNDVWAQKSYIKASNADVGDQFGASVALSDEVLAVGARLEDSGAVGINGDETNNNAADSGAVYVFRREGGTWAQGAYIKASNTEMNDWFGVPVALSGDTLVVAAVQEDGGETGINGNQADNRAEDSGAIYLFR